MALTLNATLETAQDAQSRRPLVEIVSSQNTSDIPFDGQFLAEEATNESKPNSITHSSGRLCFVYNFGTTNIKYVYTDTERTEFNFVTIDLVASHTIVEAALCELANGNIGIIYISTIGASRHLRYMVLSPNGDVVTADTLIAAYVTADYVIDMPNVILLANGTFLLVYKYFDVAAAHYSIQKRTSADFITWAAEAACSIGGLNDDNPRYNPYLMQIALGDTAEDIFLWFDYMDALTGGVEITNAYYSISVDNGATWSAGVQLTTYATTTAVGKHPVSVQKVANEMMMSFSEVRNALYMASHDAGTYMNNLTFDPVGRKLYISLVGKTGPDFFGIMEIDIDSWTETNWWDEGTSPTFDPIFFYSGTSQGRNSRHHGEYPYIPIGIVSSGWACAAVLNVQSNAVFEYFFTTYSFSGWSITQNVTGLTLAASEYLAHTWVDAASGRLYCLFERPGLNIFRVGYVDIGFYEWHEVIPYTSWSVFTAYYDNTCWMVDTANDRIIISCAFNWGSSSLGKLRIYSLSTGALIKEFNNTTHPDFPYLGIHRFTIIGDVLVGCCCDYYIADPAKKGIVEVDLNSEVITVYQPSWGPYTNYNLHSLVPISSTEVVIASWTYGLTIFDINSHTWTLLNNANTPGLTPNALYNSFQGGIAYDAAQQIIMAGWWDTGSALGVVAVSRYGAFKTTYYRLGTYSAGWTFAAAVQLVANWADYDLVMALNPGMDDLSIYAFWTNMTTGEYSIKWDLDASSIDISKYIVNGSEVKLHRSIDGSPASLSFTCSHGYLFDPQNISSLFSIYLKKGRKLNLRFGELVAVTEYWQQQGIFFVTSCKLSYERPQYPVISIEAEDERVFWDQGIILVTEYFDAVDPLTMLTDLLETHGDFVAGDIDLPVFDGACALWFQWVDTSLADMVAQVCERFGYFPRIDVDGKVSARKISGDNAVDHVYSNVTKLINFTPDDSFSNFVNQVIVTGQSHTFIEVLYAEERLHSLNGTVGWWGFNKDFTIWYSPDRSRRCRNPRLKVIETSTSIAFKLTGEIEEEISYEDPDDFYCIVTVTAPNLTALLVAAIALWVATFFLPLIFCVGIGASQCWEANVPKMAAMMAAMMILGSVGNFQYEIWAQPVGKVRQSFQATSDDEEFQALIGKTITQKIDDPLCFTQGQCQMVADFNCEVLRLQRNRVNYSKIADLRDEEGDTIQVPHPYTGQVMTTFITELTRRFKKALPGSNDGYFLDDIEGWRIL